LCHGAASASSARLTELARSFSRGLAGLRALFLFLRGSCRLGAVFVLNLFDADIVAWCGDLSSCIDFLVFLHLCTFVVGFGLRIACDLFFRIFFLGLLLFVFVLLLGYLCGFLLNFGLL